MDIIPRVDFINRNLLLHASNNLIRCPLDKRITLGDNPKNLRDTRNNNLILVVDNSITMFPGIEPEDNSIVIKIRVLYDVKRLLSHSHCGKLFFLG